MGSYLSQCCATRQIISDGQEAVIIPIMQATGYSPKALERKAQTGQVFGTKALNTKAIPPFSTTINFDSFWQPFGIAMTGVYSDCHTFEIHDTPNNKYALIVLLEGMRTQAFINDEFNFADIVAPDVKIEEMSFTDLADVWSSIEEAKHDHAIYVSHTIHSPEIPRLFDVAIIAKSAWDYLIDYSETAIGYRQKSNFIKDRWEDIVERAHSLPPEGDSSPEDREVRRLFRRMHGPLNDDLKAMFQVSNQDYNPLFSASEYAFDTLEALEKDEDPAKLFAQFKTLFENTWALRGLDDLRLFLYPQFYGSQDYSNEIGEVVMTMTVEANVSLASNKRWSEKYDDDDDSDDAIEDRKEKELRAIILKASKELRQIRIDRDKRLYSNI